METLTLSPYSIPGIKIDMLDEQNIILVVCEEINKTKLSNNPENSGVKQYICTPNNIMQRKRYLEIKLARQIIICFMVYFLNYTKTKASGYFYLDHATGIHSIKKIAVYMHTDKVIKKIVTNCLIRLNISQEYIGNFKVWLDECEKGRSN